MWDDKIQPCKGSCNINFSSISDYNFTYSNTINSSLPANTAVTIGTVTTTGFQQIGGCRATNTVDGTTPGGTNINPVYTKVFTANTGYMFTGMPSFTITINNTNTSLTNYNIQQTNQTYDSNNNLTSATFTIEFTMPSTALTARDEILWNVCSTIIPTTNTNTYTLTVQDDPNDH